MIKTGNTSHVPLPLIDAPHIVEEAQSLSEKVRKRVDFWQSLESSDFAVSLIKNGLKLPFKNKKKIFKACKFNISERPTSLPKSKVLKKEVKNLLKQDVIERVPKGVKVFENYIFTVSFWGFYSYL